MELITGRRTQKDRSVQGMKITGTGKPVEIRYDSSGEPYFRYSGRKYLLNEFYKSNIGLFYGISHDGYFSGIGINISRTGEAVYVYRFWASSE